jgi:hypothetical protein
MNYVNRIWKVNRFVTFNSPGDTIQHSLQICLLSMMLNQKSPVRKGLQQMMESNTDSLEHPRVAHQINTEQRRSRRAIHEV